MILSHKQIEEIAAAVTKDFNVFFFGQEPEDVRIPRATPIDQFAKDYLGLNVSFARLSDDGSICGLTAYADTEYIAETRGIRRTIPLKQNQILMDDMKTTLSRRWWVARQRWRKMIGYARSGRGTGGWPGTGSWICSINGSTRTMCPAKSMMPGLPKCPNGMSRNRERTPDGSRRCGWS